MKAHTFFCLIADGNQTILKCAAILKACYRSTLSPGPWICGPSARRVVSLMKPQNNSNWIVDLPRIFRACGRLVLVGTGIGGNITPVGATANVFACGLLEKRGYKI